jgi:HPt (histidine-containing phosphotransfer) domain-containing protein
MALRPVSETPAARTQGAVLDTESLQRLRELDPRGESRLLERVVAAYVSSADKLLSQLTDAESRHDAAGIRLVAHTLKSSSASVGAMALSKICERVEATARDEGVTADLVASVADLRWHLDEALVALNALSVTARRATGPAR